MPQNHCASMPTAPVVSLTFGKCSGAYRTSWPHDTVAHASTRAMFCTSGFGVGNRLVPVVSAAATSMMNLRHVLLAGNRLTDDGMEELSSGLAQLPALETLNLADNAMREAGSRALAAALQKTTRLRQLDVSNNMMGDAAGATLIAAGLSHLPCLETVALRRNDLGETCASVLAVALTPVDKTGKPVVPPTAVDLARAREERIVRGAAQKAEQGARVLTVAELRQRKQQKKMLAGEELPPDEPSPDSGSTSPPKRTRMRRDSVLDHAQPFEYLESLDLAWNSFCGNALVTLSRGLAVNTTLEVSGLLQVCHTSRDSSMWCF